MAMASPFETGPFRKLRMATARAGADRSGASSFTFATCPQFIKSNAGIKTGCAQEVEKLRLCITAIAQKKSNKVKLATPILRAEEVHLT
eukprot:CAMPEP_0180419594 /NCGR_PEP_ID=MMETSP1036_2-20121128/2182_1 /TAXON_ID=632150 /ORGANISM="Azadinium spinosum, Strain 3D9" /LENGTH=88 /DNA_ID=CAMNT_0022424765 /DNA_START=52 /DNA_END=318 /DNA_ORIENTATION=-